MNDLPVTVSAGQMAEILGITPRWLRKLATEGVLQRVGRGQYPLIESVQAYVEHRADEGARKSQSTAAEDLRSQRAREIAMRIAKQERELITMEQAEQVTTDMCGCFLAVLGGLPAQISRDVAERQRVETIIREAQGRLSDELGRHAEELRKGAD